MQRSEAMSLQDITDRVKPNNYWQVGGRWLTGTGNGTEDCIPNGRPGREASHWLSLTGCSRGFTKARGWKVRLGCSAALSLCRSVSRGRMSEWCRCRLPSPLHSKGRTAGAVSGPFAPSGPAGTLSTPGRGRRLTEAWQQNRARNRVSQCSFGTCPANGL